MEFKELVDLKEHSVESIIECSAVMLTKLFIIIINVYRPPQEDIEEFFCVFGWYSAKIKHKIGQTIK